MSDKFICCPIDKMVRWILRGEGRGEIFGIPRELFFVPDPGDPFRMQRYGRVLETPLGVAAGPHTQMAQNIVSAWLAGARYIELKTVQTLDELAVTKPCIDMLDQGYNCEWSQELNLARSFDQYLNAWILLHLLKDKLGRGEDGGPGFIFNMSVGYNLDGIRNANVQHFLDKMADCGEEKAARLEALASVYPRVKDLTIPHRISDNITLSTMHGCPPDEVEKIGRYFIEERRLNTTIKLNPTLLGPERLRRILNDQLGYDIHVPDEAFGHDLQYRAGVDLIRALTHSAAQHKVAFNLKLTNTLETRNLDHRLPAKEKMIYMSGRALHALSINLARRLQNDFDGRLEISFAGGVDCFNIAAVLACGLKPVTVCTDLLKPGGYGRLGQYLEELSREMRAADAATLEQFACVRGGGSDPAKAALVFLNTYAETVVADQRYRRTAFPCGGIKTDRGLPVFDCIQAPCMAACPAGQDIPGYLGHTARGDDAAALAVILATNPFPNLQGMVCDHQCQSKCTRLNYDNPLLIRGIKRFAARQQPAPPQKPAPANGLKVAVIGAGPSGLACAYFLVLRGFSVEIFEAGDRAGGMAAGVIPLFRLDDAGLQRDIDAILALGVKLHLNSPVDRNRFAALRETFDFVYVAVGARKGLRLGIPGEDAPGVYDQLEFLGAVRSGRPPDLGRKVIVVGGGNSALDAARTARRLVGPKGRVSIVYRRTRSEMPAEAEEIRAALAEGVELVELTAPECLLVENGRVTANVCFKMTLGEKDASGRPRPMKLEGSEFELEADSVIAAIGQRVVLDFIPGGELPVDGETLETRLPGVLAGGDAVRGAGTLIKAIGDGRRASATICRKAGLEVDLLAPARGPAVDLTQLKISRARRVYGPAEPETGPDQRSGFDLVTRTLDEAAARREAGRCLRCDTLCHICTTVCPNRANIAFETAPQSYSTYAARLDNGQVRIEKTGALRIGQPFQIINLGDFCNECGNCATFCPTRDAPYQVKPRFFLNANSLDGEARGYAFSRGALLARVDGRPEQLRPRGGRLIYATEKVEARLRPGDLTVEQVRFRAGAPAVVDLAHGTCLAVLWNALKDSPFLPGEAA